MLISRLAAMLTAGCMALSAVPASNEPAPGISAASCILQESETGTVLFQYNAQSAMPSASTVKILTALVVLENCDPDETVTVKPEYTGIEGSSAYLKAGEKLAVRDLLAGLLLASGNDAAVALACHTSGSVESFAKLMNETAQRVGATHSCFVDPNGLDDVNQFTTAGDLAAITRAALEHDEFSILVALRRYTCDGHVFSNHNKLLSGCEGAAGVKTGYTKAAGRALVSLIRRNDMDLICVTLNAPDDWSDHKSLADWAERNFEKCTVCHEGEIFAQIPVITGTEDTVGAIPSDTLVKIVPKGHGYDTHILLPRFVYAPVERGDVVGSIEYPGGTIDLIALTDAPLDESQKIKQNRLWQEIRRLFTR